MSFRSLAPFDSYPEEKEEKNTKFDLVTTLFIIVVVVGHCRSYYRCTTQKCGVKKRVERSFEDPSTVITTYEGQHNHPLPATLRGNAAASSAFFPHAAAAFNYAPITGSAGPSSNFPQELLFQMPHHYMINNNNQGSSRSVVVNPHHPHHQQQHQLPRADQRGLLQDLLFPSMFLKQEP